jgi:GWxTD domain-containing protein
MARRVGICFLILLCSLQSLAIEAVVGHTVFYIPDSEHGGKLWPNVETYWQIKPNTVHYKTTPEKTIIARIRTDIVFTNESGIIKQDHFILQTTPRASMDELMTHSIIELRRYFVTPGMITMKFALTDMNDSTNHFYYTDSFMVNPVGNTAFYSNLQLLDTTIESGAETAFKKNGKQQVPACTNFLDDTKHLLHYYAELYATEKITVADYPLVQKVFIAKYENEGNYGNFIKTDTFKSTPPHIVSGSFNIPALPSGNFYLQATLENNTHTVIASESYFFQRLNKHPVQLVTDTVKSKNVVSDTGIENVTVLNLKKTFVAKYTLAQIRAILKMLLPFSDQMGTKTITNFLKKPDELYMRYYIYNYFAAINKDDPGKAWKEFSAKITEVNKLFNTNGVTGYETDRGFIYLRYGAPSEIITVDNESGSLPYEVWQYNTLTQLNHKSITEGVFLFYKPSQMTRDYKLLHSNVSGEVQNTSWRAELFVGGNNGGAGNSRAEQYIGNK